MWARPVPQARQQGNYCFLAVTAGLAGFIFDGNRLRDPPGLGLRAGEQEVFDVQPAEPAVVPG